MNKFNFPLQKFFKCTRGSVLPFYALGMPVFLLLGMQVLDTGLQFIRHSQLQHLSRQGAQIGLLAASDSILNMAQNVSNTLCGTEFPPAFCGSPNPFDYLGDPNIHAALSTPASQDLIRNTVSDFMIQKDPKQNLQNSDLQIIFDLPPPQSNWVLTLQVKIIDPQYSNLQVSSKSFLPLF